MTLQERAKAFLDRTIPRDVDYIPGSIGESFIARYAAVGSIDLDPESRELLQTCIASSYRAAEEGSPERREYFRESARILEAIYAGDGSDLREMADGSDEDQTERDPSWKSSD